MLLGRWLTPLVLEEAWGAQPLAAVGFAASVLILQLAVVLLGVAAVAACCKWRRLAATALGVALLGIVPAAWRLAPARVEPAAANEPVLRVMSINCLFDNKTPERLIEAVSEADPDVLVLAEYVPRLDAVIRPALSERWPHQWVQLRQTNRGQAIYSKLPLRDADELDFGPGGWGGAGAPGHRRLAGPAGAGRGRASAITDHDRPA
jgi:endonuclease/exonuclease/phosphatase (EEP) superfamily protein YafD